MKNDGRDLGVTRGNQRECRPGGRVIELCTVCLARLDTATAAYHGLVRIEAVAPELLHLPDEDPRENAARLRSLLERIERMSAEQLEEGNAFSRDFRLCPACYEAFIEQVKLFLDRRGGNAETK